MGRLVWHPPFTKYKRNQKKNEKFKQAPAASLVSHEFTHEDTSGTPKNL